MRCSFSQSVPLQMKNCPILRHLEAFLTFESDCSATLTENPIIFSPNPIHQSFNLLLVEVDIASTWAVLQYIFIPSFLVRNPLIGRCLHGYSV